MNRNTMRENKNNYTFAFQGNHVRTVKVICEKKDKVEEVNDPFQILSCNGALNASSIKCIK